MIPDRNYRHTKWVGKQAISAATLHKVAYRRNPVQHTDFRVAYLSELQEFRLSLLNLSALFSLFLFRGRGLLTLSVPYSFNPDLRVTLQ